MITAYQNPFMNSQIVRKAFSAGGSSRQSLEGLGFLTNHAENLTEGQVCAFLIGDSMDRKLPTEIIASAYDVETASLCAEIKQLEDVEQGDLSPYQSFSPKAKEIVMATLMMALDSFAIKGDAPCYLKKQCVQVVEDAANALEPMEAPKIKQAFEALLSEAKSKLNDQPTSRSQGRAAFEIFTVN